MHLDDGKHLITPNVIGIVFIRSGQVMSQQVELALLPALVLVQLVAAVKGFAAACIANPYVGFQFPFSGRVSSSSAGTSSSSSRGGRLKTTRLVAYLANLDKTSFQNKPVALPLQPGDSRGGVGRLGKPGCKDVSWQLNLDRSEPACAPSEPGHPGTWCYTWDRADPSV